MTAVTVRGAGGAIFTVDVPAPGSHKHEAFVEKFRKGELVIEETGATGDLAIAALYPTDEPSDEPDDDEPSDEPESEGDEPESEGDDADPDGMPDGTVAAVRDWVGDDPAKAREALAAEEASGKPRSTLVADLRAIAGADQD